MSVETRAKAGVASQEHFGMEECMQSDIEEGDGYDKLQAPFPYFGGKGRIGTEVWLRFGGVRNYVEPFFGSGAVMLARPRPFTGTETVNDKDGMISNFWRAVQWDPEAVAEHADWPVNENDLHARHAWLVGIKDSLQGRLEGDPDYYDAEVAGWWCWGLCCWIGGGWCSGDGPWRSAEGEDGTKVLVKSDDATGQGVERSRIHCGNQGRGVNAMDVRRNRVHLGKTGQGVHRNLVHLGNTGQGDHRKRMQLSDHGKKLTRPSVDILDLMHALAERLRRVRVCCGDWSRVCGPTPTTHQGLTAVFLDPPYSAEADRYEDIYRVDSATVAHDVREWAIEHGADPLLRIALCGYEGEHAMPDDWQCWAWKASGGYSSQGQKGGINAHRERVWFSPNCLKPRVYEQKKLF